MVKVSFCESSFKQFDKDGDIHRGEVNSKDVGLFQINEYYHLEDSKKMGINIYTPEGNMKYAKYLYDTQGLRPWSASKPCWGKHVIAMNQ